MTLIKKITLVLLLTVALLFSGIAIYSSQNSAFAGDKYVIDNTSDGGISGMGYDLNGYKVAVEYHDYTLNPSGIYIGFVITLDKAFLKSLGCVVDNIYYYPDFFEYLRALFTLQGYTVSVDEFNGQMTAYLKFDTKTDYYIANNRDGYEVGSMPESKSGFLFTEYYSQGKTVFSIIETEGNLLNVILGEFYKAGVAREEVFLTYVYGTPYKIITTDADKVVYNYDSKLYLHSFSMTMDNTDRVINFVQRSPNSVGWYSLAVIIALPFIIIPLVLCILKRKKRREEI